MAMQVIEMVEIAIQENVPENKVKAIRTYHYCFQVNISESNKVTLILKMRPGRLVNFQPESEMAWCFST
jgi:hypothetical protein